MWGGVEVVVLSNRGIGGDNQKSDLKVMLSEKTKGELEEGGDVTHSWACEESHMGLQ